MSNFESSSDNRFDSAKIDVVKLSKDISPVASPWSPKGLDLDPEAVPSDGAEPTPGDLWVVEGLDLKLLRFLVKRYSKSDATRSSFLRFLDDYLYNEPRYNFQDVHRHIPLMPSDTTTDQHVAFTYSSAREFNSAFYLDFKTIQNAFKESGTWRDARSSGPMNPVQRRESSGIETSFPPLAIVKSHIAAWFEEDDVQPWRTGVILVDPFLKVGRLPGTSRSLKPYRYVINRKVYRGDEPIRTLLARCIESNPNLAGGGVPLPFVILQDIYRLIGFEWLQLNAYFSRDLHAIGWLLQRGDGNHNHGLETYKSALQSLYFIRRRLRLFRSVVSEQRASCGAKGRPSWNARATTDNKQRDLAERIADELCGDFAHIEGLMTENFNSLEQNIRHITSEVTVKEAERTGDQNRILLVLAIVGTLFLPIGAVAAIVNLDGDWAPQQSKFGLFWALCLFISAVLIGSLLAVKYWESISGLFRRLRRRSQWGAIDVESHGGEESESLME